MKVWTNNVILKFKLKFFDKSQKGLKANNWLKIQGKFMNMINPKRDWKLDKIVEATVGLLKINPKRDWKTIENNKSLNVSVKLINPKRDWKLTSCVISSTSLYDKSQKGLKARLTFITNSQSLNLINPKRDWKHATHSEPGYFGQPDKSQKGLKV